MIRHSRNDARLVLERHTLVAYCPSRLMYVRDFVIDDRSGMIELGLFRFAQHESHAAAIEECETGEFIEQSQAELVAIELCRSLQVMTVDRDLSNACDLECIGCCHHDVALRWIAPLTELVSF